MYASFWVRPNPLAPACLPAFLALDLPDGAFAPGVGVVAPAVAPGVAASTSNTVGAVIVGKTASSLVADSHGARLEGGFELLLGV